MRLQSRPSVLSQRERCIAGKRCDIRHAQEPGAAEDCLPDVSGHRPRRNVQIAIGGLDHHGHDGHGTASHFALLEARGLQWLLEMLPRETSCNVSVYCAWTMQPLPHLPIVVFAQKCHK